MDVGCPGQPHTSSVAHRDGRHHTGLSLYDGAGARVIAL
jgi:hypothetical protein